MNSTQLCIVASRIASVEVVPDGSDRVGGESWRMRDPVSTSLTLNQLMDPCGFMTGIPSPGSGEPSIKRKPGYVGGIPVSPLSPFRAARRS